MDKNQDKNYYKMEIDECLSDLKSNIDGLSSNDALLRLKEYGNNSLKEQEGKTLLQRFIDQFKNVMVIILLIAALVSVFLREYTDTIVIFLVVILNALMGVIQESKAEKALSALKEMSSPYSKVKRNGKILKIKTEEIVPGDIVILEAGDNVPADMRLIESASLRIEESSLTGESVPVEKNTQTITTEDTALADRVNIAFMGSSVVYGRGLGLVVKTGMGTEVGHIAEYLSQEEAQSTPLQRKLEELGKYISIAVIGLCILIFIAGLLNGRAINEMFLTSISLAVAAIPEGLPAIVTIVLAIGVQKMAKRNAIIRKLPAVETLGCTQIICSDKTGTLTQNKMTVVKLYTDNLLQDVNPQIEATEVQLTLLKLMALCNDSEIVSENNKKQNIGDPTEVALVDIANKYNLSKSSLVNNFPRQAEIPFDSDRKLMTTIHKFSDKYVSYTKGAVDELLTRCTHILTPNGILPLTEQIIDLINLNNKKMAQEALRVLAGAYKIVTSIPNELSSNEFERDLVFVGLMGMIDPPREEVKESVELCRHAGIRPIMITGDHKDTAVAIAKQLGILDDNGSSITGAELEKISDEELVNSVDKYSVYARVSPEHKVRIVKAWKSHDKIVAMTGDGVNDAPALKFSDIGVGMGITGTDVSKGVSDMVLSDDNFASIVYAVREGRRIFSNIRKSIQFLLSANIGEVITLFIATMLGWPILYAIHILWINLVTDTLPALALGVENEEADIMYKKPRSAKTSIFAEGVGINIIYQGFAQALITLLVYYLGISVYNEDIARTMAFVTLGLIQLMHSSNVRSKDKSLFNIGLFSNRYLIGAIVISIFFQTIVVLLPFLNSIFHVQPLTIVQWLIVIIFSIIIIPIVEIVKLITGKIKGNTVQ